MWRYMKPIALLFVAVLTGGPVLLAQGIITTVAGTEWVFASNGAPALNTPLGPVSSVSLDTAGNLIVADAANAVVIRVDAKGIVTVLAGNGLRGYSGDGGPAINASLNQPNFAIYDRGGNLLIADTGNNRVRSVSPDGTIRTIAGNGIAAFAGDGASALQASFNLPFTLAVDASNAIYLNDFGNARIRRITAGGIVSTIAGDGQSRFSGDNVPAIRTSLNKVEGIAIDSAGSLYLADFGNHRVRKVDAAGIITTIAGDGQPRFAGDGGPAAGASLNSPSGVAVDSSGNIYISDTNNTRIRRVTPQGTISTYAGTGLQGLTGDGGPATRATFLSVTGLAADLTGNLFVADRDNYRIRHINPAGIVNTVAGNGGFRFFPSATPAANAFLSTPYGVSIDSAGDILIADTFANRIRLISTAGLTTTLAGTGVRGYSDGAGIAAEAALAGPTGATPDGLGNVYIADTDNHLIRKVSADGKIINVAGNGNAGFSGDGGAALSASLNLPQQVVLDRAGNLYISDRGNHRVRRVTPAGVISTFAGNGQARYAGDGGPAISASLNTPRGLAFDAAGNLYIADAGNGRVRRVSPAGVISTVAGGGFRPGAAADSFPALEAQFGTPLGVATAPDGSIFVSDGQTDRIVRIAPSGILSIVAGGGSRGFSGDGGLSTRASLNSPYGLALDPEGNLLIADSGNNRVRSILARRPSLNAAPAVLSFSGKSGGTLTAAQRLEISGSPSGLAFIVTATTVSGGGWLKTSASGGSVRSDLQAFADPTGLSPGTYQGSLVITSPVSSSATTVPVSFVVSTADAPRLGLGSSSLTFNSAQGGTKSTKSVSVTNLGGGAASFTASVTNNSGGAWLSVSPSNGQATPTQPAALTLEADPARLAPGAYSATLSVVAANSPAVTIPVLLTISDQAPNILLSQTGFTFTAVEGGGSPPPESIAILNDGSGELIFEAKATTLRGGSWLSLGNAEGRVAQPLQDVAKIDIIPDSRGLSQGDYYAEVRISGTGVKSPKIVTVLLKILPAGSNPGPDVRPASLVFVGAPGAAPSSEDIRVTNLLPRATGYASSALTYDGGKWVTHAPAVAAVNPGEPRRIVVQPDFSGIEPGVKRGVLTLVFEDGTSRIVNILSIIPAASTAKDATRQAASCPSDVLRTEFLSLRNDASVAIGQPVAISVKVVDECGNPLVTAPGINATVQLTFSNRDPNLPLIHTGNGVWTGSWRPLNPSQAAVDVNAISVFQQGVVNSPSARLQAGRNTVSVRLGSSNAPIVRQGSVVHSASQSADVPVAPGMLVTIYGSNLTDGDASAAVPLPTEVEGTQVLLGGQPLPILFASPSQINAQVPFELTVNTLHQVVVRRGVTASVPEEFTASAAQPGIFTTNNRGTGQGAVLGPSQSAVADPANPALRGQPVVIYCTGLGAVNATVALGA
ncbi:MAG: BACON domain-containing protein, partial [Bryobacteraceae bacterium]